MGHELDQSPDLSETAFIAAREGGWHRLGTVKGDSLTIDEVMTEGHLGGWQVRAVRNPQVTDPVTGQVVTSPDDRMILRTNPFTGDAEKLGMCGKIWTPFQNEDQAAFLAAIVEEGGAFIETGGSINEGRDVFITMRLPEGIMVGGVDPVDMFLSTFNNHSARRSLIATIGGVRVVCKNTQEWNLATAVSRFALRHTGGLADAVEEARKALQMSWQYRDEFQAEADKMLAEKMSNAEFDELLVAPDGICGPRPVLGEPHPDTGKKVTALAIEKYDAEVGSMRYLFREADTNELIRGTHWAAYQAFVEHLDWFEPVAGKRDADLVRAERTISSADYANAKTNVFELLRVG